ncbi:MAG: precorrin-2 C(20)-methyltransferase [Zhongshania sp.]|uniref:precorrin-2 C(20)-methyltransferase n=1 Tax=Zhongshania sp. TaxID=1971902 RepID=UPI0026123093|nr:precorrin-2 C(20)-methyltransferase [Zhongshania sp.]MDF1691340.1 precorrin-2 C(20)-methyltransferase [Zhongshania sp.]
MSEHLPVTQTPTLLPAQAKGIFYGVGVGPGDPELLTLKAHRLIAQADVIAFLENADGHSQAAEIAAASMSASIALRLAIYMPMNRDRALANAAYDDAAQRISEQLRAGRNVVFLCEGDPLFFGSFAYLMARLAEEFHCEVVPGISSINAAAARSKTPLAMLAESFAVLSGRHAPDELRAALGRHDTVVILKAGQARPQILAALSEAGRQADARYLEFVGRPNERIVEDVRQLEAVQGPYFSLFLVSRSGARA